MGETEEEGKSERGRMQFEGNNHARKESQHGKTNKLVPKRKGWLIR